MAFLSILITVNGFVMLHSLSALDCYLQSERVLHYMAIHAFALVTVTF